MTIAINSCISVKLVMRETARAEVGCAGCRLGTRGHQGCSLARSERANFDRIVKMKTVRMTAITAFCFVLCQVSAVLIIANLSVGNDILGRYQRPPCTWSPGRRKRKVEGSKSPRYL